MSALARNEGEVKQKPAIALGLLAASVLPAAYFAIVFPLSGDRDFQSIVGTFLVAYFFAAAATVILGAPMFLLLNKLKLVSWWSAASSGALVGVIALFTITSSVEIELVPALRFATLGGVAGFVFWLFWRVGRT